MAPRGVSMEEKCKRMLDLLHERKECFQLKELEKLGPIEKGITTNSVKDVVEKLVDQGAICSEEIGSSTYFWSFPNTAKNVRKRKLNELKGNYEETSKRVKVLKENAAKLTIDKEEVKELNAIKENITDMQINKSELEKQLEHYRLNDPEAYKEIEASIEDVKTAANRWTDNIFQIKTWCFNKFAIEHDAFNKQFMIPSDFDYLD